MAEHERVNQDKKGDVDQRHRTKRQDSQPLFDQSHAWDNGSFSLTETPFHPRMDEHATILSSIPFSAQRHEFIMRLHQTYGNRYVQRLMESIGVQAKLTVSEPGDIYEQEADRVAETVTRTMNSQVKRQVEEEEEPVQMKVSLIQRQEEEEEVMPEVVAELQRQPEEEEEELQTQPDASQFPKVSDNIENRIDSARGGGQRLSDDIREPMAQAFNTDFSGVRVHTDSEANALNQQLSAKAFTSGQEIFFREGEYNPNSDTGKTLLAHELTHVVQQRGHVHAQRHTWEHSTTRGQTIQRVKRDETGNIVGLDMATCSLVGVAHEEKKSFATVKSEAWMSKPTHSVVYEIKWDAAVVPGGDHLGQVKGQASDWVVDKSIDGEAIGDRGTKKMIAPYFKNDLTWELDPAGRFFSYNDPIEQRRLQGGSWWFGLKVVDEKGSVLSQSHDVEVNWG